MSKPSIALTETVSPVWTHRLRKTGERAILLNTGKMFADGNMKVELEGGGTMYVPSRDLKEIKPKKPDTPPFEPTHILNGIERVRLTDGDLTWNTVIILFEDGREMQVDSDRLRPIKGETPKAEAEELVEFIILRAMFQGGPIADMIERAFGFEKGSYSIMEALKVTCRPDQFGVFCALLAMRGRNLNHLTSIRIFKPQPERKPNAIDARYLGVR